MTKDEKQKLAAQLNANPLLHLILDDMEQFSIDKLLLAETEQQRVEWQERARSVRTFRSDFLSKIGSDRKRRGAPA